MVEENNIDNNIFSYYSSCYCLQSTLFWNRSNNNDHMFDQKSDPDLLYRLNC